MRNRIPAVYYNGGKTVLVMQPPGRGVTGTAIPYLSRSLHTVLKRCAYTTSKWYLLCNAFLFLVDASFQRLDRMIRLLASQGSEIIRLQYLLIA